MAELTPEMQAQGIFLDAMGNLTLPDGTPALWQPVPAQPEFQLDVGPEAAPQPLTFGFGPSYNEIGAYPENREPLDNLGMETPLTYDGVSPINWQDYLTPNDRSTGGGFFTAQDLFGAALPMAFQQGADQPSTNNYRLLPHGYNFPRYIMRNSRIIDMGSPQVAGLFGTPSMGEQNPPWRSGAGMGVPSAWANSTVGWGLTGWPGQIDNYAGSTMPGGS